MFSEGWGQCNFVRVFAWRESAWPMRLLLCAAIPVMVLVTTLGSGDHSAWLMTTTPIAKYPRLKTINLDANSFYGYSGFWDNHLTHKENFSTLSQMAMFSGGPILGDYYALRPIYPFLASTVLVVLGWKGSMIAINLTAWLIAVPIVFVFALRLTDNRRAASWAALFSLVGMGFVVHIHDYSAHLLSFTLYFICVFLAYESGIWRERRPWWTHLALGSFLAIAALEYNTGLLAIAGYAIVGLRHNGVVRTTFTAWISAVPTFLWPPFLNFLSGSWVDYGATERLYRQLVWEDWTSRGLGDAATTYVITIVNYLSYEMCPMILIGCCGIGLLLYEKKNFDTAVFVFAFFLMPIFAMAVYAGSFLAKGYLTYQTAIFIYVGAGFLLARFSSGHRPHVLIGPVLGTVVWFGQLAWNLSYLLGIEAPTKMYFLWGYEYLGAWMAGLWNVPIVVSLTGLEPVPGIFGGSASLAEAGAAICRTALITPPAGSGWLNALEVRAPFTILVCVSLVLLWRQILRPTGVRRALSWSAFFGFGIGLSGLVLILPALWNSAFTRRHVPVGCMDPGTSVVATTVHLSVTVSSDFVNLLKRLPHDVRQIEVLQGFRYGQITDRDERVELAIGSFRAPLNQQYVTVVDREEFVRALENVPRIDIEADSPSGHVSVHGWQANGTPDRLVMVNGKLASAAVLPVVPEVELRARAPGPLGLTILLGF